ncbi:MAG: amidohydrolase family protein [Planctomycetes bacterium]|nr:amidohydrolase family protein [Planctomycetota bacterium]MBL7043297.1 amidohydrolase family protein [Pirellulaceae bacterium]
MITDVNVYLERWPFRRLPCDEPARLVDKLRAGGVTRAWVGSFDGLLHKDIGGVNARLAHVCKRVDPQLLIPFGSVNPKLPDWPEDIRRCHEDYHMPGIRLHPNYHGYTLDDPVFAELLTMAEKRGLIVQLAVRMEDVRTQHPLMQVPDVEVGPVVQLVKARPRLRLVLLNSSRTVRGSTLIDLVSAGQVYCEIAMLEGIGGVASFLNSAPLDRVLFGSHLPLFNLESATLKLRESVLSAAQRDAITHENARRLFGE